MATPIRRNVTNDVNGTFTVPGLSLTTGHDIAAVLQGRLHALNELQLTLKHAHWNVVGPMFIAVHEMLDPQIDIVRAYVDELAERMAALGTSPNGLPGALTKLRDNEDYTVARAGTQEHIAALNDVYTRVIEQHREAIAAVGADPLTEDLLIGQARELEQFQWFLRAHLENAFGELAVNPVSPSSERSA